MGEDFPDNAIAIDAEREGVRLDGHVSIPSYTRANALQQYAYVNGRPVRDKLIASAHPRRLCRCPAARPPCGRRAVPDARPGLVDVNVHPAKADVRFRDPGLVRGLIVGAIRQALAGAGIRAGDHGAAGDDGRLPARRAGYGHPGPANGHRSYRSRPSRGHSRSSRRLRRRALAAPAARHRLRRERAGRLRRRPAAQRRRPRRAGRSRRSAAAAPQLGAARAQVHENYIVAQTAGLARHRRPARRA